MRTEKIKVNHIIYRDGAIIVLLFLNYDVNKIIVTEETEDFFYAMSVNFLTDNWLHYQKSVRDQYLSDKNFYIVKKERGIGTIPTHIYFLRYEGERK